MSKLGVIVLCGLVLLTIPIVTVLLAQQSRPAPQPVAEPPLEEGELVTTKSGLKYRDVKVGEGKEAARGKTVVVHYTGFFPNGKKFDSSLDRNEAFPFHLGAGEVIKGWDEGVSGMKVGGKRRLYVPYALAYGDRGQPPVIPPQQDLNFDVELLEVK